MKITSFTRVTSIDNVKCFKPISKLFIKRIYDRSLGGLNEDDPTIRVRLVDGATGNSKELVPEMKLSILSEIASKYEGFQRKAAVDVGGMLTGFSLSTILLGAYVGDSVGEDCAAIDLSNDKYIDIDMRNCDESVQYEIWGVENHVISNHVRVYSKFYLSAGELEKTFHVGENEQLVLPIQQIKEIQLYSRFSAASPTFRKEELILDEDGRNDLVSVRLDEENRSHIGWEKTIDGDYFLQVEFGYSKWGVMTVTPFDRFDVRRDDGLETLMFLMIDTTPTRATEIVNVSI